ncbi:MAG: alpha-hydroxy acid oxidase [Clostridia bacterium]
MDFSNIKNRKDANELTREYFDSLLLESRYIDSVIPDTSFELFGKKFDSPIMIAAFSHLHNWHEKGMPEMAKGAKALNICNWAGMGDEEELDSILATGAQTIKIIKPYADRKMVYDRIEHACKSGALAVGIDIDHSFSRKGYADLVQGFTMNPITFDELADFVKASTVPFIIKGVLSVDDAVKCMNAGVKGIVVSHHHGRMSYGVPTLMALPKIKEAVGDKMEIFVDCGIDSGIDTFKALALGAKAVNVGRAVLPSFKEKGAQGVIDCVNTMNDELRDIMACTGCSTVSKINSSVVWDGCTGKQF